jgi:hypothetical protein
MKKFFTLIFTIFFLCLAVCLSQECAIGTNVLHRNHNFTLATVNSHPGGTWSPSRRRLPKAMIVSGRKTATWMNPFQGSGRRTRQPDFPLERCAILFMSGVGVGYATGDVDAGLAYGAPAIAVAVALPFPGQKRQGRFQAKQLIGTKLLGLLAFSTSYALGLGIGDQLHFSSQVQ